MNRITLNLMDFQNSSRAEKSFLEKLKVVSPLRSYKMQYFDKLVLDVSESS